MVNIPQLSSVVETGNGLIKAATLRTVREVVGWPRKSYLFLLKGGPTGGQLPGVTVESAQPEKQLPIFKSGAVSVPSGVHSATLKNRALLWLSDSTVPITASGLQGEKPLVE